MIGPQAMVTVAGAGALGLSCALALADAGCAVTVCDPALDGPNASSVAAGMLAPVFEALLDGGGGADFDLLLAARDLWPGWAARSRIVLDRSGAAAVGSPLRLSRIEGGLARLGLSARELDRRTLADLAPGLSEDFERGLMTGEDWRLDARPALKALRTAAAAAGVAFRAEAVTGRGGSDWLVVATGAAQGLARAAPELARLSPIKGQILRFRPRRLGVVLRGEGAYAAPGAAGLIVGATMEPGLSDTRVDPGALAPVLDGAAQLFPALAGAAFTAAAGVRAATPDGLPLVGPSADPRVLLAVGARRNGWLLAPLVATIIAAHVAGSEPGPYALRLAPARFS